MKKVLHIGFTILSILFLVSCYIPLGEQLTLNITDLGALYNDGQKHVIKIECSNPYASVYYRTDGTRPDSSYENKYYDNRYKLNNGQYACGVTVPSGSEIVAIAVMYGYRNSEYCYYSVNKSYIDDIEFYDHGTCVNNLDCKIIEITCSTDDVTFYYTENGSIPSDYNSFMYSPSRYLSVDGSYHNGVLIEKDTVLNVVGKKSGYYDSSAYYDVSYSADSVAAPVIIDHGTYSYDNSDNVIELRCDTPDAIIRYTTDGTTPYEDSKEYSYNKQTYRTIIGDYYEGILVAKGKTVTAIGQYNGFSDSVPVSSYINPYSKSVNLNSQWQTITDTPMDYDSSAYNAYESYSNHNIAGMVARMSIDICGYSSFHILVMSDAESSFDYVKVYDIDSTTSVKESTKGKQNEMISVDFNDISTEPHTITIDYVKDGNADKGRDRGYVFIPID